MPKFLVHAVIKIKTQAYNKEAFEIKWAEVYRFMLHHFGPEVHVTLEAEEKEEDPTEIKEQDKPGGDVHGI